MELTGDVTVMTWRKEGKEGARAAAVLNPSKLEGTGAVASLFNREPLQGQRKPRIWLLNRIVTPDHLAYIQSLSCKRSLISLWDLVCSLPNLMLKKLHNLLTLNGLLSPRLL